jgi:hypothetical protein
MSKNNDLATVWAAYRKAKGLAEVKLEKEPVVIEEELFLDDEFENIPLEAEVEAEAPKPNRLHEIMSKHMKVKPTNED